MKHHTNITFLGGTLVSAIMVMTAFANVATASPCPYSSKSAEATTEEVKDKADKKAEVEA